MATRKENTESVAGDTISRLYPKVDETETPLPRSWSPKDKCPFIGLSQTNLRVHYKGKFVVKCDIFLKVLFDCFRSSSSTVDEI